MIDRIRPDSITHFIVAHFHRFFNVFSTGCQKKSLYGSRVKKNVFLPRFSRCFCPFCRAVRHIGAKRAKKRPTEKKSAFEKKRA